MKDARTLEARLVLSGTSRAPPAALFLEKNCSYSGEFVTLLFCVLKGFCEMLFPHEELLKEALHSEEFLKSCENDQEVPKNTTLVTRPFSEILHFCVLLGISHKNGRLAQNKDSIDQCGN